MVNQQSEFWWERLSVAELRTHRDRYPPGCAAYRGFDQAMQKALTRATVAPVTRWATGGVIKTTAPERVRYLDHTGATVHVGDDAIVTPLDATIVRIAKAAGVPASWYAKPQEPRVTDRGELIGLDYQVSDWDHLVAMLDG